MMTYKHVGDPVGGQVKARLEPLDALSDAGNMLLDVLEVELYRKAEEVVSYRSTLQPLSIHRLTETTPSLMTTM